MSTNNNSNNNNNNNNIIIIITVKVYPKYNKTVRRVRIIGRAKHLFKLCSGTYRERGRESGRENERERERERYMREREHAMKICTYIHF